MASGATTRAKYELVYSASSDKQVKTVKIKWTIFQLDFHADLNERVIRTKDYRSGFDTDSRFQLKLEYLPECDDEEYDDDYEEIPIDRLQMYFLAPTSVYMTAQCESPGFTCFMEKQMVEAGKWNVLPVHPLEEVIGNNDKVVIDFEFIMDFGYNDFKCITVPPPQLNNDLENLLNNSMFSDTIIKSLEGEEFHVHKVILAMRSEVFKAQFDHDLKESMTSIVETAFEADILKQLLTFIYTDNVPEIANTAQKLLVAADYYQIERLKKMCEDALSKNLTVENAIDTLELASLHSAKDLEKKILNFINVQNAKMLIKTTSWEKLQSIELIRNIFEHVISNVNV